jgi:hypothetical protein
MTVLLFITGLYLIRPFDSHEFFYGYVFCLFLSIGIMIRKSIFKSTIKKTKEKFENVLNE